MLAVPLKECKGVDFSGPLRSYISSNYGPEELDKHASSIQRLSTTRERVAKASGGDASVDALESYIKMLNQVEPRFPLGEGGLKISFVWFDALKPSKKLSMSKIGFEKASVLFNLGAVYSHQGMVQDRSDVSGLKKACAFFQKSAGIFAHLRDNVIGTELIGPTTTDMQKEGLEMLYYLMLAQSQACFYEKAIRDGHKPAILSKLAQRASRWYEKAHDFATSSALSSTLDSAWPTHLEFQLKCFTASAQFQYSKVVHEKAEQTTEGFGEEIARLGNASEVCEQAIYVAQKGRLPESMLTTVTQLRSVIHQTMQKASDDNNKIYMQMIPPARELKDPPGTALAKPTPPAEELVECGPLMGGKQGEDAIFAGLLPVAMQEAEALYHSRLSHMVETSGKKVTDNAEKVKLSLAEAGLPQAVEAGDSSKGLPDAVWERLNSSVLCRGGVNGLKTGISSNEGLARKIGADLSEISDKLMQEEREDTRCRSTWGSQWATSSSAELSLHMRGDINRYETLLKEAKASDGVLHDKLTAASRQLEILGYSRSRLNELFPSSKEVDNNPDVEATREELALMLVTLGTNIQTCEELQGRIIDQTSNDSIAEAMTKAPGGPSAVSASEAKTNALIEKEVAKYRPLLNEIDRYVQEQPRLLSKVLDKNHKFSMMRNQSEAMLKREGLIAEIDQAIRSYEEIVTFIVEGEKFYHNLQGRIEQLKTTAMDHCYVREIQRKELEADLASRSGGGGGLPGSAPPPAINGSQYPGMSGNKPGYERQTSQPLVQAYVPAQAYPISSEAAPAYPVSASPVAPPPAYSSTSGGGGNSGSVDGSKIAQMRAMLGNDIPQKDLEQALAGAGNDVNIAVNHILTQQEKQMQAPGARNSKRSSKRFGLF